MAKNSTAMKAPSRIRFVMVEAELGDGDIGQITQAIQNALRPPAAPVSKRIAAPTAPSAMNGSSEPHAETEVVEEVDAEVDAIDVTPPATKAPRPRKAAPKPAVITIDTASEPPLSSLADPKSNHKRYLAIAAWLHDHRDTEVITQDHIYTCYRHLGWPTDILDFAQPLRELKHKQFFTTPERGKYAINQLGLAKAKEVGE
jgi:hypothetical protein